MHSTLMSDAHVQLCMCMYRSVQCWPLCRCPVFGGGWPRPPPVFSEVFPLHVFDRFHDVSDGIYCIRRHIHVYNTKGETLTEEGGKGGSS